MYIDPDDRVEDNRSTAWSFTLISACGIILLVLLDLGILPVNIADAQKIMMTIVMGIVFLIFLSIGIHSFLSINKLKDETQRERAFEKEIHDWFLTEYADAMYSFTPEEDLEPYYPRYDRMSELIIDKYPGISEEFKDHIIDELYGELFPDS